VTGSTIGKTWRRIRLALGHTQHAQAKLLGITNVHVSNVETGFAMPSWELVRQLEKTTGVNVVAFDWLISRAKSSRDCQSLVKLIERDLARNRELFGRVVVVNGVVAQRKAPRRQ
jgi:transcriptional regulator with XRE-family HTH domain